MTGQAESPAGRKPPLSRERIVAAAVDLADRQGLEALSMRNLGKAMGVEAMSLYNHVAGKDDLLDAMADAAAAEMNRLSAPDPAPESWRDAMRRRARAFRGVCSRHPWAGVLLDTRLNANAGRLAYYDAMLGALLGAGFGPRQAVRAFMVMDSYLYGFEAQLRATSAAGAPSEEMAARLIGELPAGSCANLARVSAHVAEHGYDQEAEFEAGFEIILDAIGRLADGGRPSGPGA